MGRERSRNRAENNSSAIDAVWGCPYASRLARNIATKSEARLVLLHVVHLNIAGEEYGIPRTRLLNDLCQNAEAQLQQLADCLGENVATEVLICHGRPGEVIVETATRLKSDIIVMRSPRHRAWQSWYRRNTARTVLRKAPCKVCLVLAENSDATVGYRLTEKEPAEQNAVQTAF